MVLKLYKAKDDFQSDFCRCFVIDLLSAIT